MKTMTFNQFEQQLLLASKYMQYVHFFLSANNIHRNNFISAESINILGETFLYIKVKRRNEKIRQYKINPRTRQIININKPMKDYDYTDKDAAIDDIMADHSIDAYAEELDREYFRKQYEKDSEVDYDPGYEEDLLKMLML